MQTWLVVTSRTVYIYFSKGTSSEIIVYLTFFITQNGFNGDKWNFLKLLEATLTVVKYFTRPRNQIAAGYSLSPCKSMVI